MFVDVVMAYVSLSLLWSFAFCITVELFQSAPTDGQCMFGSPVIDSRAMFSAICRLKDRLN